MRRVFLTNETFLCEAEVTLRVDVISNICLKRQLSQNEIRKEAFSLNYSI